MYTFDQLVDNNIVKQVAAAQYLPADSYVIRDVNHHKIHRIEFFSYNTISVSLTGTLGGRFETYNDKNIAVFRVFEVEEHELLL